MENIICEFTLNGHAESLSVPPNRTLLHMLREDFMLTGVREGCGHGECGSCNVIMDGQLVNACLILAVEAAGADILTIEGLAGGDTPHPIQQAFIDESGLQCGACTTGMVLSVKNLLDQNPEPSLEESRDALAGNFCRCTGYAKIYESVDAASRLMKGGGQS
ncbi:MAG: (2Fe-2S)-binding protein [Rhodospirillales bacterium]|jgi:carbon-monoxide dehydrogenase small subunit|nr:(2Fe-2S)-binding protein [Rhodospirillales bacterium]